MSNVKKTTTTVTTTVTEEIVEQKPLKTIVAVVIDESGSMDGKEDQVFSLVNEYVNSQKNQDSKDNRYYVCLTQFNHEGKV